MKIQKLNENINESLSPDKNDGWSEEVIEVFRPFQDRCNNLFYELNNTIRGAETKATNIEELKEFCEDLAEKLEVIIDTLEYDGYALNEDISDNIEAKEDETETDKEVGVKNGMSALISELIIDEYQAIQGYDNAIVTAKFEDVSDEDRDAMINILTDIQREENVHVGQLQELLKIFNEGAKKVEDGNQEGKEQIEQGEGLTESYNDVYNSFKEIENSLDGDGEAITSTIEKLYMDNKGNPDYEEAYNKWISERE